MLATQARPGEAMIESLLASSNLVRCTAASEVTGHHLASAHRRLESGALVADQFPEDAIAAAHDAIQRSFSAYLNEEGLRPTSAEGKHAAIIDAVEGQLFARAHNLRAEIRTLKALRNTCQYGTEYTAVTAERAHEALRFAGTVVAYVEQIIAAGNVRLWH